MPGLSPPASDVSFTSFNPAALVRVGTAELAGNLSGVFPSSEGTVATGPAQGVSFDSGQGAAVPAFAAGLRINEVLTLGLKSQSPFGS